MPLKTDSDKRWVEMEYVVPGTPEQVWQAMATGAGNAAWFTNSEIEERVGGVIRFHFGGGMTTQGEVQVWDPPRRFGYVENEWMENAPPVRTEIDLIPREGDECLVRMSHIIATRERTWDHDLESFEKGWPGFFAVLGVYLRYFAGRKAASFQVVLSLPGQDDLGAWKQLTTALGLAGANVGEEGRFATEPEAWAGRVEKLVQDGTMRTFILKLEEPTPGIAILGTHLARETVNVNMSLFIYGDDAPEQVAAREPQWREWFAAQFPNAADEVTW